MTRSIKKRKDITDEERLHIYMMLVKDFDGIKLLHGSIKRNAELYGVSCKTVSRLWEIGSKFIDNGDFVDVSKKLSKHVGQKRIQIDIEMIKNIPLRRRKTMASLAHALEVSKATFHRRFKDGLIRRHSNSIKPQLTDANKKARLQFCLSMIQVQNATIDRSLTHGSVLHPGVPDFNSRSELKFSEMFDHIVIDEKWFYMSKETERYYLTVDEVEPHRSCKNKKFITKVMFLAAVAHPRFDELGDVLFDGKIGIFPFTYQEPAKRRSKNRVAGTMETKPINAVTQDVSRTWMIEKIFPAIREKWPMDSRNSTIFIQQDNARPHIKPMDDKFLEASSTDNFDIRLTYQPPNSPELNVLDLGYFRAIQSLQYQEAPRNIDELVAAVEKSFYQLSPKSLNRVFLTLQSCMLEVLISDGNNDFKIPHLNKKKMETEGRLPLCLTCNYELLQKARNHLLS